ncbi:MAG: hypothetical protein OEU26_15160 [Candidatus Tectomicrobia bacterium]|nr:hypothetical protein [Candidatus Tectomicrobia bacterium]
MGIAAKNILIPVEDMPKVIRDQWFGNKTEIRVQEFVDLWIPNMARRSPGYSYAERATQRELIKKRYIGLKETELTTRDSVTWRHPEIRDQLATMDECFITLNRAHAEAMASYMGLSQADLALLHLQGDDALEKLNMALHGTPF